MVVKESEEKAAEGQRPKQPRQFNHEPDLGGQRVGDLILHWHYSSL